MYRNSYFSQIVYFWPRLTKFAQADPGGPPADPRRDPCGRFRIFDKMCTFFHRFYRKITSKVEWQYMHYLLSSIHVLGHGSKFGDFWWIFENLLNNQFFRGNFTRLVRNALFLPGCSEVFFRKVVQNCPKLSKIVQIGKKGVFSAESPVIILDHFLPIFAQNALYGLFNPKTDLENFEKNPKKEVCPL